MKEYWLDQLITTSMAYFVSGGRTITTPIYMVLCITGAIYEAS